MSSQDELISQFKDVTGTSSDRARFYLESSDWALQVAISSFYESEGEVGVEDLGHHELNEEFNFDTTGPSIPQVPISSGTAQKMSKPTKSEPPKKVPNKPRVATLHNMAQRSSDDEEEGEAFYAGGSERSGQQVLGPPRRKNFREQLTEMIRTAHESGAVVDPMNQPAPSTSRGELYHGAGLRLGQTESDHQMVTNTERPNRPQNIDPVILKLWSQGFSINDGELRPYDDPENKEFIETVMRGQIPNELRQMGSMVSVDLEDHRHEDYKKPVTKFKTFKGSGHTLGSPAPNVEPSMPSAAASGNPEENQKRAVEQLKVNSTSPTTMLQIRLADGTRLSGQFNHSHTIDDIRQYIITNAARSLFSVARLVGSSVSRSDADGSSVVPNWTSLDKSRPQYENQTFILVTSFPTKELTDGSETIEKAGLLNASLMQRLK